MRRFLIITTSAIALGQAPVSSPFATGTGSGGGSGCTPAGSATQILVDDGAGGCTATTPTISGSTITATIAGLASTATALATPRAINGVNFDGTAAITVTAAAGTLTGATLNSTVTASSLTSFGASPTLTTPTIASFTNAQHNHSNAAGGGQIASSGLNITPTTCTNQVITAISAAVAGTCASVVNAMITNSTIDLTAKVTGTLPFTNGGFGIATANSGGIPYFSGSTSVASSAAWTANTLMKGGGAGVAPAVTGITVGASDALTLPGTVVMSVDPSTNDTRYLNIGPLKASYDATYIQPALTDSPYIVGILNQSQQIWGWRGINQNNTAGAYIGAISGRAMGNPASGTTPWVQGMEGDAFCAPSSTGVVSNCYGIGASANAVGTGSSVVTDAGGVIVYTTVKGSIAPVNNYGILIQDQASIGSGANFSIYTIGNAPSFFGGGTVGPGGVNAYMNNLVGPPVTQTSGRYYSSYGGPSTPFALTQDIEYAVPFIATSDATYDRMVANVTTGGAGGSVLRFGIYADANGCPGNLVLDAGTVASTGTGAASVTISQALTVGTWYWLSVAPQVAAAPSLTVLTGDMPRGSFGATGDLANNVASFYRTSITGALTNWGGCGSANALGFGPRIALRKS
jgi:hypothetical protein